MKKALPHIYVLPGESVSVEGNAAIVELGIAPEGSQTCCADGHWGNGLDDDCDGYIDEEIILGADDDPKNGGSSQDK